MEGLKKGILVKNGVAVGALGDKYFSTAPIGVIQAFSGTTIPHGYLLCDGTSYKVADYPDLYAVIGNIYGGDSTNFNVPNLVDKFVQGSTTSGEEKEAGLPNITGTFYHDTNATSSLSGAFFSYTRGSSQNLKNDDGNKGSGYVSFDASKSNAIYGNSNTVQPPALTMVYIIKAFHTNEGVDSGVSDDVINYIDTELVDISRMKIYTNVKQLGLESECSTVDIFKAMPNNSLAIIGTFPIVSDEYCKLIDKPIKSYEGLLTIVKFNHARFSIEYKLSGDTEKFPNRMYVGNFAGSEPTTIDWQELATMDEVVKYPDWSNQQTISQTEITVDQDVYIELNQLNSSPIEDLKINGKKVSVSDVENGLYSTRFSGYVKKGSFVSYPYLTNANLVRVFPLV